MSNEQNNNNSDVLDEWFSNRESAPEETPIQAEGSEPAPVAEEASPTSAMDEFEKLKAEQESSEGEESPEESEASLLSSEDEDSEQVSDTDVESLFVKGADGRKQKVEINYADKKAIKQAYLKAAGMRKFQAERDKALKSLKATEQEHSALKEDMDKLSNVFEEKGVRGIVELLKGDGAWQSAVDEELAHRDYVSSLSADERFKLKEKETEERYQSQLNAEKQKREQFESQIREREEQAQLRDLESKLHPSFDRYRFAGKLNDTVTENFYDKAIWKEVQERLGEYPDDMELSQAVIDKEFRTVANSFRKHIKTQTETQVRKSIENKKAGAAKRAQVAAKKGLKSNSKQTKILQSLQSGNLSDALDLWRS